MCGRVLYMKSIVYPLRIRKDVFERVEAEAEKRKKKVSEVFRDLIIYGFKALPPVADTSGAVADTWEKLGPAPDVLYDRL